MKFMKILILTSAILCKIHATSAQTIVWDGPVGNTYSEIILIGKHPRENAFYFLKTQNQKYFIQKYDSGNNKVFEREIGFSRLNEIQDRPFNIGQSLILKDKFVFMIFARSQEKSTTNIFLLGISFDGEILGTNKSLHTFENKTRISDHLALSPDSSKITMCIGLRKQKQIEANQLDISIYNQDLDELSSRKLNFPEEDNSNTKSVGVKTVLINNSGGLVILGTRDIPKVNDDCSLWYLDKNVDQLSVIAIGLVPAFSKEIRLVRNDKSEPVIMGFYSDLETKNRYYVGYFYGTITDENKLSEIVKVPIPETIQNPPWRADVYFPSITIISKQNKGHVVILEYTWVHSNTAYFSNLMVLSIDGNGMTEYATSVSKNQVSFMIHLKGRSFVYYYSYLPIYEYLQNRLHLYFNDNPNNAQITNGPNPSRLSNIDNSVLASVSIEYNGTMSKTIFTAPDNQIAFSPLYGLLFSKNKTNIMGVKQEQVWLGQLKTN